ncbi:hypothetical protein ACU8MT_06645 [Rhizobium leguminosarum]
MSFDVLRLQALLSLAYWVSAQERTEEDETTLNAILDEVEARRTGVGNYLLEHDIQLSRGQWLLFVAGMLANWSENMWTGFQQMDSLREYLTDENCSSAATSAELDAVGAALTALGSIEFGEAGVDVVLSLMQASQSLAKSAEGQHPKAAYDLAACAVLAGVEVVDDLNEVQLQQLLIACDTHVRLAVVGEKLEQIVVAHIEKARVHDKLSSAAPAHRVKAFQDLEIATEALMALPEGQLRDMLSEQIGQIADASPHLRVAIHRLLVFKDQKSRDAFRAKTGVDPMLKRIHVAKDDDEMAQALQRVLQSDAHLISFIDLARFELHANGDPSHLSVDWTNWRVNHHAYQRAVPQNRSFLREQDFAETLAELVHETTHVMTTSRQIGFPLFTCRMLLMMLESFLLASVKCTDIEELFKAKLEPGCSEQLGFVHHQLSIAERMEILQDTWTPWFEGLAVFAETAVIPVDDELGIADVVLLQRNLVDFNEAAQEGPEAYREAYEAFVSQFEGLASNALSQIGPDRLRTLFRSSDGALYSAGYVTVRRILSEFRNKLGEDRSGAELFAALYHATCYGIRDSFPPFDLPAEAYKDAALQGMSDWIDMLNRLSADDIKLLITRDSKFSEGRRLTWRNGQPLEFSDDDIERMKEQLDVQWQEISGQLLRLLDPEITPLASKDPDVGEIEATMRKASERAISAYLGSDDSMAHLQSAQIELMYSTSLMPIGSVDAGFALCVGENSDFAHLCINLITTERHRDTKAPSYNFLVLPMPRDQALRLMDAYNRTRVPYMRVTRLEDLAGVINPDLSYMNYFLFEYGDEWNWAHSAVLPLSILEKDNDRERFIAYAKRRLGTDPTNRVQVPLSSLRERCTTWLDESHKWVAGGINLPLQDWADALRAQAVRIGDSSLRAERRRVAGEGMLRVAGIPEAEAAALAERGFVGLTENHRGEYANLIEFLLASARRRSNTQEMKPPPIPTLSYLFSKYDAGWDL